MSSRYTNHPISDEKWYEEKCRDFQDGKCDSWGHSIDKDESSKEDHKYDKDDKDDKNDDD